MRKFLDIRWDAPIIPGFSLAGINLDMTYEFLKDSLLHYCIDKERQLYQFNDSPILFLESIPNSEDSCYFFVIYDKEISDHDDRALVIRIKDEKIHSISAWYFELNRRLEAGNIGLSYQGTLPNKIKLGIRMDSLLQYYNIEFDDAEEWFYAYNHQNNYIGLTIGGGADNLEDNPDQRIRMLMVNRWTIDGVAFST